MDAMLSRLEIWSVYGEFFNYVAFEYKRDPFFPEESEMLKYLKEYAKKSPYYKENKLVRRIINMFLV